MAWTDISNVLPGSLPLVRGSISSSGCVIDTGIAPPFFSVVTEPALFVNTGVDSIYRLHSLTVTGFDDGYRPNYVPDPIVKNIGQPDPDATGEWPTSRFLYPRGY